MPTNAETALALFQPHVGQPDGAGSWIEITQDRINKFADATDDHQFIHINPEQSARMSPYKVTIAHGFLTLSMLTALNGTITNKYPAAYQGVVMGINYGLDKVRFPSPVKVKSKIRGVRELLAAELKAPNTIQLTQRITVEIEGEGKPGCVAEWLTRLIYA